MTLDRATRRLMQPHMRGKVTPDQAREYMEQTFSVALERAAAKRLLREIVEHGYTAEMAAKVRTFLERHPG